MQADALAYVRECDKCQRFAPMIHQPARELNPLSSPWPFAQWGLDIVGPLPRALGNKRFLIVTTDYFTKWVEAEPLTNIRDVDAKRFFGKASSHGSGCLGLSFRIMEPNLKVGYSRVSVRTSESKTFSPLLLIHSLTGRPRCQISYTGWNKEKIGRC
jgi:hypothetical protein